MSFLRLIQMSPFIVSTALTALTALNLASLPARAAEGGNSGGGGDASEARVDEIRADILRWIAEGGAKDLKLPARVTHRAYVESMRAMLQPHRVIVNFVTTEQESRSVNAEQRVTVDGAAKTCRGFLSAEGMLPHILCNIERFAAAKDADQYRLVHHEYAGLAGIELNQGASSDYEISNQLTDFLVSQTVLRLAVRKDAPSRKTKPSPVQCKGECRPEDFVGEYFLVGQSQKSNCGKTMSISFEETTEGASLTVYIPDTLLDSYGVDHDRIGIKSGGETGNAPSCLSSGDAGCHYVSKLRVKSKDNSLLLIKDYYEAQDWLGFIPVDPEIVGSHDRSYKGLRPDASGRVQFVSWALNEASGNYFATANCSYERRTE